jgi:hypothetical protein
MKVGRSNRGEILGRLVGILVLLLVPIWALGHWLSPISPSATTSTNTSDASATEPTVDSHQNNHQIDAKIESLVTGQELLVQQIKTISSKVDGQSKDLISLDQSNAALQQAMSEQKQTLSERFESTQSEMARLKSIVVDSTSASAVANDPTASMVTGASRAWTSTSGKQVNAALLGREGNVAIMSARGQSFRVPLDQLVPADQDAIRKQFPTP